MTEEENRRYTEQVVEELKELDPIAFRQPDTFWSQIFAGPV
jgi:hypothetical protein